MVNLFRMNLLEEKGWWQNFHHGTHIFVDCIQCYMSIFEFVNDNKQDRGLGEERTTKSDKFSL